LSLQHALPLLLQLIHQLCWLLQVCRKHLELLLSLQLHLFNIASSLFQGFDLLLHPAQVRGKLGCKLSFYPVEQFFLGLLIESRITDRLLWLCLGSLLGFLRPVVAFEVCGKVLVRMGPCVVLF
jgi:hypothetical protein